MARMTQTTPSPRPADVDVDVLVVGAGISGIDVAWRLHERRRHTTYVILEAREEIGGTWDLFRYPGIRSDSDIATFAFPFRPWVGERVLAEGQEIKEYVEQTAAEAGITERIRFGRRVSDASWSSQDQRWTVTVHGPQGRHTLTCSFLHLAAGYYDYGAGYQPDFPGREDFAGSFVHPQQWPADLDVTDKRVVVIGSGATAMTLIPALARTAEHVTMLQRTPSWVASMPNRDRLDEMLRRRLPTSLAYRATRTKNILFSQGTYALARRRPERFAAMLRSTLLRDLPDEDYLDAHFTPDYQPWDQRVCRIPGGDLTKEIAGGRAGVLTGSMDRLVPEGVRLADGEVLPAEVIVSATGLQLQMLGGITLTVDGAAVDPASRVAYRGLMLERVPNMTFTVGYVNSSWTLRADLLARYLCRLLDLMDRRGHTVATPGTAPAGERAPLLDLKAGYVLRSLDKLPSLGPQRPWTYAQNYLVEAPELLLGSLRRDMEFTSPKGPPMPQTTARSPGRYEFAGGTAVVTGAAGGIGEQLARQLGDRGSHLALADRRAEPLEALAADLRRTHPDRSISTHVVDLADRSQVAGLADAVLAEHSGVTLLINNAGVALGGRFDQISDEEFDWLLQINLHAPIALVRAFLPALSATPGSQIVNLSSLFGLVAPGGQTAYVTSKFGLRGFSQALGQDLAHRGIGVTSVHPGGVRTRIAQDSRTGSGLDEREAKAGRESFERFLSMHPAEAARIILHGVRRRRSRVIVGRSAKALDILERVIPTSGGRMLSAGAKRVEQHARTSARTPAVDPAEASDHLTVTAASPPLSGVRTLAAAKTQVRVRVTGPQDGEPVLLVHGIGRSLEDWTEQHSLLKNHRVISLDLPGFGYTPAAADGMELPVLADAAVATLDALEEHRPVHLVGNSLGGAVAMTLLARHPDRVRSLTLADSAGFGSEVTPALRVIAVPGLGPWLLTHSSRSRTATVERSLYADPALATDERLDRAMRLAAVPGAAPAFRAALVSVGGVRGVDPGWREDLLGRLRAYPVPTLVLWGEQDQVLPATHLAAAARALPHAHTVLLPDTGHLPQVERPEQFADLVRDLWKSCD